MAFSARERSVVGGNLAERSPCIAIAANSSRLVRPGSRPEGVGYAVSLW